VHRGGEREKGGWGNKEWVKEKWIAVGGKLLPFRLQVHLTGTPLISKVALFTSSVLPKITLGSPFLCQAVHRDSGVRQWLWHWTSRAL